jgi:hypothetical protein
MAVRRFSDLSEPIKADPVRGVRIGRLRAETIAEIAESRQGPVEAPGGRPEITTAFDDGPPIISGAEQ